MTPFQRMAARPRIGSIASVESIWSVGSSVELLTMSFAPRAHGLDDLDREDEMIRFHRGVVADDEVGVVDARAVGGGGGESERLVERARLGARAEDREGGDVVRAEPLAGDARRRGRAPRSSARARRRRRLLPAPCFAATRLMPDTMSRCSLAEIAGLDLAPAADLGAVIRLRLMKSSSPKRP